MARSQQAQVPAPTNAPPDLLRRRLGFLIGKAAQRGVALVADALRSYGLKSRHYGILVALSEQRALSQQELGLRIGIDRTTMTKAVDDLQRLGCVVRHDHPTDRRAFQVSLTARGRRLLEEIEPIVASAERAFQAPLSAEERRLMRKLAARLAGIDAP
jgi:DNA-binding MarR family transcriptional regulator